MCGSSGEKSDHSPPLLHPFIRTTTKEGNEVMKLLLCCLSSSIINFLLLINYCVGNKNLQLPSKLIKELVKLFKEFIEQ